MLVLFRFMVFVAIKYTTALFYTIDDNWFNDAKKNTKWRQVNLIVFLNHTSLFEPIFLRIAPLGLIWQMSSRLIVPGADVTVQRPVLGRFFKLIMPGMIPVSRKRDDTWQNFLGMINSDKLVAILPEGRMMRKDGLDKDGKPMSVRGGVADILLKQNFGKLLFVYSGGLHHVQAPGDKFPKLFKRIKVNLELLELPKYKSMIGDLSEKAFKSKVIEDMENRLRHQVPK